MAKWQAADCPVCDGAGIAVCVPGSCPACGARGAQSGGDAYVVDVRLTTAIHVLARSPEEAECYARLAAGRLVGTDVWIDGRCVLHRTATGDL